MSWLRERRVALAAITLFTLLAGDFWRYSITWFGWGAIILLLAVAWAAVAMRARMPWRGTPIALVTFGALCVVSTVWSNYPPVTALGALTTVLTIGGGVIMERTLDLAQVVRALGVALRWVIGLSLAFELVVATVVRAPVLPLWVSYEGEIPRAYYWSRAELFEVLDGGRIQGIVGNANLLGFAALLAVIVFSVQLVDRRVGQAAGWGWLAAAVLAFVLAGSSTMVVAAIAVAVVLGLVLLARRLSPRGQRRLLVGSLVGGVGAVAAAILARDALLGLLGRSGDLTNRVDIWAAVSELIGERPVLGWGWVSYWAPWVEPFDGLVVIGGVQYLQAHNAWLDVTLQLGILGLVVFAALAVTTAARAVTWAVDAPLGDESASAAARMLPVLVLALLLVQSLAESRLLLEAGLLLLSWIAVASRSSGRVLAGVGR